MSYVLADPSSVLNFSHDWTDYLALGETISSRQWSITPVHPGTPQEPVLTGSTTDTVFVASLVAGNVYHLVERIVTSAGVTDDRTIVIRCEDT